MGVVEGFFCKGPGIPSDGGTPPGALPPFCHFVHSDPLIPVEIFDVAAGSLQNNKAGGTDFINHEVWKICQSGLRRLCAVFCPAAP